MSNITEPQTFLELVNDFISRVRAGGGDTDTTVAKRLLNTALVKMHEDSRHKFPWAEKRGVIITHAPYTTGTVSITAASSRTDVTGSSTAWDTVVTGFGFANVRAGGKIKFSGSPENYEVATVPSATSLTLRSTYVGDDLSAASYTYFEDEYALESDFLRPVDLRIFSLDRNIPLISRTEFRRHHSRNDFTNRPREATLIQLDYSSTTAPRFRVVFHPVPADEYQIPYWYVSNLLAVTVGGVRQERMSSDNDEPIVPKGKRHGITLWALMDYYRDYRDDARAQMLRAEYDAFMGTIIGEVDATDPRPQFYVRRGGRRSRRGRFDYQDRFNSILDWDR